MCARIMTAKDCVLDDSNAVNHVSPAEVLNKVCSDFYDLIMNLNDILPQDDDTTVIVPRR